MLAKKFRLPIAVFPAGAKIFYRGQYATVKVSPNSLAYNRVGVIVTKKTAPRAVERNRLRRKIFDLFRADTSIFFLDADTPLRPAGFARHIDLLVLVKPTKLDADAEENLFKELNLTKQGLTK